MIRLKLHDSKGSKKTIDVPTTWQDLTLKQLIRIELEYRPNPNNLFILLEILTGIDSSIAENSTDSETEQILMKCASFMGSDMDFQKLKPNDIILIDNVAVAIPQKIDKLMLGQKMLLAQHFKTHEELIKNIGKIIALMIQPKLNDGKFETDKIPELEEKILKTNGLEAFAIVANGFFLRTLILKNIGLSSSEKFQPSKSQIPLASASWHSRIDWNDSKI